MSMMFDAIEKEKPDNTGDWLTEEQKSIFEATYFECEESAFDILNGLIVQNGLGKEFILKSEPLLGSFPIVLEQTDYNPMIEAMSNWNEYIAEQENNKNKVLNAQK